jgi:hypothetical protein
MNKLVVCVLAASLFGCGDNNGNGADASSDVTNGSDASSDVGAVDAPMGDASDGGIAAPVSLTIGPFSPGAGVEQTKCATMQLANVGAVHIGAIHTVLTGAWRDLVVYRVDDTTPSPPSDCSSFVAMGNADAGTALTVTQRSDEELQLPTGDGFTFADHQMIRLELHGVDDGTGFGATVTFEPMLDSTFKNEAGMVFIGFIDISIPPSGNATLHQQAAAPAITVGSQLLVLSGHEHALATEESVALVEDGGAPTSVYDGTNWSTPPVTTITPYTMTTGTKIDTTCTWINNTANTVKFGESANDEQCFVRAHFAPATGSRLCVHSDQYNVDVCCPGDTLCAQFLQ